MINYKNIYIKDNEEIENHFRECWNAILALSPELIKIGIDIEGCRWFRNYVDIYLPMFEKHLEKSKTDWDIARINEENDKWMRVEIKAFLSDVEKSIKWFISLVYKDKKRISDSFLNSIKHLISVSYDYPPIKTDYINGKSLNIIKVLESELDMAYRCSNTLDLWRNIYNNLKHDDAKEVNCYKTDRALYSTDGDIVAQVGLQAQNIFLFVSLLRRILIVDKYRIKQKPEFYSERDEWGFLERRQYKK